MEKNGFHLERCLRCGLVQVTDDLSKINLSDYYKQEFFDHAYMSLQRPGPGREKEYKKFHYRMDQIEKLKPGKGNILDIGCSFGLFLDVARSRGWHPVGIEIGEYAAKYAREELDIEVHVCDLLDAPLEPNSFDVITMWNVIEHVEDPVTAMLHINSLLKPNGLLVFTTGNVDSYLGRLQGAHWRMYIPPIHVANFSARTVERMLKSTGFEISVRTVALPRESLLRDLGLIGILKALKFSDKMMIFATKVAQAEEVERAYA